MNIRPLRSFAAIVDYGGLSRAAERLNISQPALSAALKGLERELGVALFERRNGRRGMRLTAEGRRFYQRAVDLLRDYDAAKAELRDMPAPRERLLLGVLGTLPPGAVRAVYAGLSERFDDRLVGVWEGTPSRLAGWLSQGRVDVVWSAIEEAEPDTRVLWREPFVLAAAHDSELAKAENARVEPAALGRYPFILRSHCEMGPSAGVYLRNLGIATQVVVRTERDEVAFDMVARGLGITLAPRSLVPDSVATLEVTGLGLARTIGLRRRGEHCSKEAEIIADCISDVTARQEVDHA